MNGFLKFRQAFQKNKSYLILIVLPIAFTLIFGGAMSPIFVDNIPIAVYDEDHSPSSKMVRDQLADSPSLKIVQGFDSMDQIKEGILTEKIRGCVTIPEGFGKDLKAKKGAKALVLIDGSNLVIGNNLQSYVTTIFSNINAGVQIQLLEGGDMVPYQAEQSVYTLNVAERMLYNPQLAYFYYLFAGLLAVFVQQTFLAVTVPVLIAEKVRLKTTNLDFQIRKKQRRQMVYLIVRYGLLSVVSVLACLLIGHYCFAYPLSGNLGYMLICHAVFICCLVGVSLVISAIFDDVTHGVQLVMFFTIPTMLSCGYAWPEYIMAPGFAPIMKMVWPLYYYANPLRDLMLKGVGFSAVKPYVIGGLIFAIFWIPVGGLFYWRKIRTMKRAEEL